MKIAYTNAVFLTMDENETVVEDGLMITDDDKITYIGPYQTDKAAEAGRTVSLKGKWVLPGLVNTHSHVLMTMLRGSADDMPLHQWLTTKIWPMEEKFTTELAEISAMLGILEMIKSGTTTFSDMFNPTGIDADALIHSIAETGIKGAFSYSIFSSEDKKAELEHIRKAEQFTKRYRTFAGGRMSTMTAPHSPYACNVETLQESARIASENNTMIHLHVSETRQEVDNCLNTHSLRPIEYLEKLGIFIQPTIMAHGVYLTEVEIDIMKNHNVRIAHNPISNLKLGSGIADIKRLLAEDILVGIATDSTASNNNLDMFEETRTAALLQKGFHEDAGALPLQTTLSLATRKGAEAVNKPDTGQLRIGKKADFITVKADQPHFYPLSKVNSHVLYSISGKDVCDVFIDGTPIMQNKECLTLDEEKIKAEAERLYMNNFT
ncbi:amidohydrolase family protein [Alteribacillus sp. HJP-4]|uniref:amidohydrolase family protein n=1 Tax=Alteribacillus sp. HJP-4 TaxID=2775394 RepID=UPI0035CD0FD1